MAIKLVAVDMDDTLLDDTLHVSQPTCEAIAKAQEQGIIVTIATGRMFSSVVPFAKQLNIEVPVISYNGGMVRYTSSREMVFHQCLDEISAGRIVEIFRERGWYLQSYMDDVLYVVERCEKARFYEDLLGIKAVTVGNEFYNMKHEPTKMLSLAEPHEIQEIQQVVDTELGAKIFSTTSKAHFLEITHPEVNKGRALAVLAEKLMIRQEEIMAIGDSNNDYPMIQYAGFGVAMGNASDRVKGIAQAVTADNNHHGVAEAIKKYALAK